MDWGLISTCCLQYCCCSWLDSNLGIQNPGNWLESLGLGALQGCLRCEQVCTTLFMTYGMDQKLV